VPCSASRVVPGAHRVVGPGTHQGSGPREVHTTGSSTARQARSLAAGLPRLHNDASVTRRAKVAASFLDPCRGQHRRRMDGRPTTAPEWQAARPNAGVCRTTPAPDLQARRLALGGGGLRAAEAGSAHRGSAAAALALISGCAAVRRGVRVTNPNRDPFIWPGERSVGQLDQGRWQQDDVGQAAATRAS
jgi:hypothetical protein